MELNEKKEITLESAKILMENPGLSMRAVARKTGKCTSTTLKKFFDTILPEYYPDINLDLSLKIKEHQLRVAKELEENTPAAKRRKRELKKVEKGIDVAQYIIDNHATMQQAAEKFSKPLANIQRSLNMVRKYDEVMRQKLNTVFAENKENYYRSLSGMTRERIANIRREVKYISESEKPIRQAAIDLHISQANCGKDLADGVKLVESGEIDSDTYEIAKKVVDEWNTKKSGKHK